MNIMKFIAIWLLVLTSCKQVSLEKQIDVGDVASIKITITRLESKQFAETKSYFVYGKLEIYGLRPVSAVNLNCVAINVDGNVSKNLYVDSVAHVLTNSYKTENNSITVDVYWVFDEMPSEKALDDFKIMVINGENCFS